MFKCYKLATNWHIIFKWADTFTILSKLNYKYCNFIELSIAVLKFGSRCTDSQAKGWGNKEREGGGWKTRFRVVCYFTPRGRERGVSAVFSSERQVDEMSNMFLSPFFLFLWSVFLRFSIYVFISLSAFNFCCSYFSPNQNKLEREKEAMDLPHIRRRVIDWVSFCPHSHIESKWWELSNGLDWRSCCCCCCCLLPSKVCKSKSKINQDSIFNGRNFDRKKLLWENVKISFDRRS